MRARIRLALIELAEPRVARALLMGLSVALLLLSRVPGLPADPTCPGGSGGGCDGG